MSETSPFDKRCADALADEVAVLVRRKVIDMRSPAADALLDYREPPSSPRADRIAQLEAELAEARRERDEHREGAINATQMNDAARQGQMRLMGEVQDLRTQLATVEEERNAAQVRFESYAETLNEATQEVYELRNRLATVEAGAAGMREALEHDQTGMINALSKIIDEVNSRSWIEEGRGPYEWDDDRYREETGIALRAVREIAESAVRRPLEARQALSTSFATDYAAKVRELETAAEATAEAIDDGEWFEVTAKPLQDAGAQLRRALDAFRAQNVAAASAT